MDRKSDKYHPKNLSINEILAQPLKLKESLRIRDGLSIRSVRPARWAQVKTYLPRINDLGDLWFSNN